ncbi:MAG: N-6 DNA methylase [Halobacteriales archaeon]|nr:N-6 DNA methylase [Halobacteriales archaeon]
MNLEYLGAFVRGHVPTPPALVDAMVGKLFHGRPPKTSDVLLDPGCGDGPFIEGVLRYCVANEAPVPRIIGIEQDPKHVARAREKLGNIKEVTVLEEDYLASPSEPVDYIVGNPPYVPITGLSDDERARYRAAFASAVGRFDLYLLFFERSLRNLRPGGRLCFVTPEKFLYVHTAAPFRRLLSRVQLEEIHLVDEASFPGLVTYPTVTTLTKTTAPAGHTTTVRLRDATVRSVALPRDGSSWSGGTNGMGAEAPGTLTLKDVCIRVSCGVATGSDDIFVHAERELPQQLRCFSHPTVSGRQLAFCGPDDIRTTDVMLVPYDARGKLIPEDRLGDLRTFLLRPDHARRLKERTCVTPGGHVWYRFHDNVPFEDILRPKLLCKDIAREPQFWPDRAGRIVPRHSVYYIVPQPGLDIEELGAYLNSETAATWLKARCQRAANGFLRLQSEVLKELPLPATFLKYRRIRVDLPRAANRARAPGRPPSLTTQAALF